MHEVFAEFGGDIAALIVEPVAGNMNCVLPAPGFLEGLLRSAMATVVPVLAPRRVRAHVAGSCESFRCPVCIHCDSVGVSGIAYVPGVNCRLRVVDGYTRRYVVWVPLADMPGDSPAVFMLHGGSGTGEEFLIRSGWREKATQEGFIAIFPTAVEHFVLDKQRFSTRWNNYGLPVEIDPNERPAGSPATSPWPADDVKFIRQIGEDVIQQLSTDPKRVYVAGFSSGGGMSVWASRPRISSRRWPATRQVWTRCTKRWSGTAIFLRIFLLAPWMVTGLKRSTVF